MFILNKVEELTNKSATNIPLAPYAKDFTDYLWWLVSTTKLPSDAPISEKAKFTIAICVDYKYNPQSSSCGLVPPNKLNLESQLASEWVHTEKPYHQVQNGLTIKNCRSQNVNKSKSNIWRRIKGLGRKFL